MQQTIRKILVVLFVRAAVISLLGLPSDAFAQSYRQMSSVLDGAGNRSSNTVTLNGLAYTNVSAIGQPGGVAIGGNSAAGITNYAGFLQAVDIKRPNQRDIYGNPFELTPDNDADGLTDVAEVSGSEFSPSTVTSPNNADSDGDGASDRNEAVAGTNPADSNRFMDVVNIAPVGQNKKVQWTARSGKSYRVLSADQNSFTRPTNVIDTVTVTDPGAASPWYETTGAYTNAGATQSKFYAVEVLP